MGNKIRFDGASPSRPPPSSSGRAAVGQDVLSSFKESVGGSSRATPASQPAEVAQPREPAPTPEPSPKPEPSSKPEAQSDAKEEGGGFFGGLLDRAKDVVKTAASGWMAPFHGVVDGVRDSLGNTGDAFGHLFKGEWSEAFKSFKAIPSSILGGVAGGLVILAGRQMSALQTMFGIDKPARELTAAETAELRKVYGDQLDYSKIEIKEDVGGILGSKGRPFVLGNTIIVPKDSMPLDLPTLVHEAGHVWQSQKGGPSYSADALWAQYFGDAYNFAKGIREGKSWKELDPEQQAQLIQKAYEDGFFDGPDGKFEYAGNDYTDYMRKAVEEILAGRGAS